MHEQLDDTEWFPFVCPSCGSGITVDIDKCRTCDVDLRPLIRVASMADLYYNRAVADARERQWNRAAENLAVALALRPDDVDALVLMGKVRVYQADVDAALEVWERVRNLDPVRNGVEDAVSSLKQAMENGTLPIGLGGAVEESDSRRKKKRLDRNRERKKRRRGTS